MLSLLSLFVPVVPEGGDNEITDQLGDLFGNLDVEHLGDTIDVADGNASQDLDLGEQTGNAIDSVAQSCMGLSSSFGWFGS